MDLLLSHWHCIVPAAAILIGILLVGRNKKQSDDETTLK